MGKTQSNDLREIDVSVIMPCLNEAQMVGICIEKAREGFKKAGVTGEVIVVDNDSEDDSARIASSKGAKVIKEPFRGYGSACIKGIREAKGKYVVLGDADDTYDFTQMREFLRPLQEDSDFVIGSRFKGKIFKGAMPWAHRYIGNPFLTNFLRFLFGTKISDAHCGMRAFKRSSLQGIVFRTSGMEFASEMIVNALRAGLKIEEIPINYYPRKGQSKMVSFRDAWRHIRFMLLFSPTHLFLIPGLFFFILGMAVLIALLPGPLAIGFHRYDTHFMVVGSLIAIFGFQTINLGLYARTFSLHERYIKEDRVLEFFWRVFNLEKGLLIGSVILSVGLGINIFILWKWIAANFGELFEIRRALFALTLMVIGMQTIFSSFFLSLLGIKRFEIEK